MSKSYVSKPLLAMLESAGIAAPAVARSITRQTDKNCYPVLRAPHPYIRQLRNASGLHVTEVSWRYGRLLVTIEQMKDGRIHWTYREFNSRHCSFQCRVELPETLAIALRGKPLSNLTNDIDVLADVRIAGPDDQSATSGWSCLKLSPDWIAFQVSKR